jgi:hypothetical protein
VSGRKSFSTFTHGSSRRANDDALLLPDEQSGSKNQRERICCLDVQCDCARRRNHRNFTARKPSTPAPDTLPAPRTAVVMHTGHMGDSLKEDYQKGRCQRLETCVQATSVVGSGTEWRRPSAAIKSAPSAWTTQYTDAARRNMIGICPLRPLDLLTLPQGQFTSGSAMHRLVLSSCFTILGLSACSREPDIREVMAVVLDDFSRRTDTASLEENGVTLIRSKTHPWPDNEFQPVTPMDGERGCRADQSSYDNFVARNRRALPAGQLIANAEKWRLATSEEEGQPPFDTSTTSDDQPVKTMATLYAPGFSRHGREAFVYFAFSWSIHGARASYVLKFENEQWLVTCSQLNFAV